MDWLLKVSGNKDADRPLKIPYTDHAHSVTAVIVLGANFKDFEANKLYFRWKGQEREREG